MHEGAPARAPAAADSLPSVPANGRRRKADDAVAPAPTPATPPGVLCVDDEPNVLERAQREHRRLFEIEQEERGVTHAEVGGQLLGLWGLTDGIVEAVAYHHHPQTVPQPQLDAVAALATHG